MSERTMLSMCGVHFGTKRFCFFCGGGCDRTEGDVELFEGGAIDEGVGVDDEGTVLGDVVVGVVGVEGD